MDELPCNSAENSCMHGWCEWTFQFWNQGCVFLKSGKQKRVHSTNFSLAVGLGLRGQLPVGIVPVSVRAGGLCWGGALHNSRRPHWKKTCSSGLSVRHDTYWTRHSVCSQLHHIHHHEIYPWSCQRGKANKYNSLKTDEHPWHTLRCCSQHRFCFLLYIHRKKQA